MPAYKQASTNKRNEFEDDEDIESRKEAAIDSIDSEHQTKKDEINSLQIDLEKGLDAVGTQV